jgi:hypothetical protein
VVSVRLYSEYPPIRSQVLTQISDCSMAIPSPTIFNQVSHSDTAQRFTFISRTKNCLKQRGQQLGLEVDGRYGKGKGGWFANEFR